MISRPRIRLAGDRLTISGADATLVFLDRELADPDRSLVGALWTSFLDRDAASNLPLTAGPTFLFRDDDSLQVATTCNTGAGQYSVPVNRITLTSIVFTERACEGASAFADMHIRTFISDGMLTYEIEAARLILRRGDTELSAISP